MVTRDTPWPDGTPCWVDLGTHDIPKAIAFYTSQFGWQAEPGPAEMGGYSIATLGGRNVAGIGPIMGPDGTPSSWTTYFASSDVDATAARITGLVLLYCLRFALAAPETARGLRRMVLDVTPLPVLPKPYLPETVEPPCTKKAIFLALYRAHPDYGDRSTASRVAAELAPHAGLQAGTARTYLYAELDGRKP